MVGTQDAADRVEHPGGVEGRNQREEVAARIRETGDRAGRIDRALRTDREDRTARSDRDHDITGTGADPEGRARVVSRAGGDTTSVGIQDPLTRSEHPRQHGIVAERRQEEVAVVAVVHELP